MKEEWLLSLSGINDELRAQNLESLQVAQSQSRFYSFLKAAAAGEISLCRKVLPNLRADGRLSGRNKMLGRYYL